MQLSVWNALILLSTLATVQKLKQKVDLQSSKRPDILARTYAVYAVHYIVTLAINVRISSQTGQYTGSDDKINILLLSS